MSRTIHFFGVSLDFRMVGRAVLVAALTTAIAIHGYGAAPKLSVEPILERCPEATFSLDGRVGNYMDAVTKNWLLRAPDDNPAVLAMFADRDKQPYRNLLPWSGEFAGKLITSMDQMLRLTGNADLQAGAAKLVRGLTAQQADDGYLGPFPTDCRLTGKAPNVDGGATWDAWGHYHSMLGMLLWYADSHDPAALECACRIGDLLCSKFPSADKPVSAMGSMEMNQAVAHSLALLYEQTGEKKYLELAERVVDDFAAPGAGDYLRMGLRDVPFFQIPKPRWESLHAIMGLAELYWITGNKDYQTAFENLWWSIARLDRHNNGGFSSGEQAQGNPYHPGAIETCCTIAWMALSVDMLRMTGDSRVADELELSTLNQVMGTYDSSGRWSTYNTPMDGRRVPNTIDIAFQIRPGSEELNCCSVNAARGFGMISDWAVMRDKDGLTLNWYGPSEITAAVRGTSVSLKQRTNYPADGQIDLSVDPSSPVEFTLKLRIPHWSKSTSVQVNGETVPAKAGSYLAIKRRWKSGDKVQIDLDMSFRFWAGEQQCAGKASIYRGPLLLAYEEANPSTLKFSDHWNAAADLRVASAAGEFVEFTFEGDAIEWHGARFDDAGKARASIDDHEIEIVDQHGAKRGEEFVWKRDGLGLGRHKLRIDVLGEKSAESQGTSVNYFSFKTPTNLPRLNARRLKAKIDSQPAGGAFLTIDVEDATGQPVRLRDFGSAGHNGALYSSWLPVEGVATTEFSKTNPSRTAQIAD